MTEDSGRGADRRGDLGAERRDLGPYRATPLLEPGATAKDPDRAPRQIAILWRLTALLAPHKARFALALVTLAVASIVLLIYPQAVRYTVDVAFKRKNLQLLDHVLIGVIAIVVLQAAMIWLRHFSVSWLGERVVADLRTMVFERMIHLPLAWFHERRTGELVGRLASDVTVIEGVVGSELPMALRNAAQLVIGLVLLFTISWQLTLIMLAVVPPVVVSAVWFGKRIRRMSKALQEELAAMSGHVQETLGAIQTVQSFVREGRAHDRYRSGVEGAFQRYLRLARWRASFLASTSSLGYIAIGFMLWVGGRALIRGELSAGDLTSFFMYTMIVAVGIADLASLWEALQRAAGATDRLYALIDAVPEIRDPEVPTALPAGSGALAFEDVTFAYPSRHDQAVLRHVDLAVAPGEVVALVGSSGAGKSTLLQLLFRFYDVDRGRVTFEGVDVRELRLADLRHSLAMVAQEPVLFAGTLRENIAFAREGASAEEIERAARDANAHDFILRFPAGYDTVIGERGVKLSGGQKQRVAIARAILADPRVLILDEATSSLDAESEALVQQGLARLMAGRTTLVVAHRLSTVRDADRIVVLQDGRIVEQGRHEELMARAGTYRRLVEHQVIADVGLERAAAGERVSEGVSERVSERVSDDEAPAEGRDRVA